MHAGGAAGDRVTVSPARQKYIIGALLLMYIFAYMDRNVLALMVDEIKQGLHISDVQFSLVHGMAFGAFYALFGLPMGYIVDRFSSRWVLFAGISFWSLATVFCGLSRSFQALAISRFGVGVGEATLVPAAYSTIARILPKDRIATGIAIFSMGSTIGSAVAIALGGYLIATLSSSGGLFVPLLGHLAPWQAVFVVIGAPGVLVALLAFTLPDSHRSAGDQSAPKAALWPFLVDNARYLFFMNGGLAMVAVMAYGLATWMPALLLRQFRLEVSQVGFAMSMMTLTGVIGFFLSGYLADRLFRSGRNDGHILPIFYCTLPAIALSILGFHFSDSLWLTLACYTLIHIGLTICNSTAAHIQMTAPAALRGRLAAITVACQHLCGLAFGPLLIALVTDEVFGDPARVGDSMTIIMVVIGLITFVLYGQARAEARAAAARTETSWQAAG